MPANAVIQNPQVIEKGLHLLILTPERTVFDAYTDYIILQTSEGELGVLSGHEPYCTALDYGVIRLFRGRTQSDVFALLGGFATITQSEVIVLSPVAERPEEMDHYLNEKQRMREENVKSEQTANLEVQRAENALRNALINLEISAHTILPDINNTENGDADVKK